MQLICVKSNQVSRICFVITGYTLAHQSIKVITAKATSGTEEKETVDASHKVVLAGTLLLISFVCVCVPVCVRMHAPFLTQIQLKLNR